MINSNKIGGEGGRDTGILVILIVIFFTLTCRILYFVVAENKGFNHHKCDESFLQ